MRQQTPPVRKSVEDTVKAYGVEMEAIKAAAIQVRRLEMTPPVDDDFPQVKYEYDQAVRVLMGAMLNNNREPRR